MTLFFKTCSAILVGAAVLVGITTFNKSEVHDDQSVNIISTKETPTAQEQQKRLAACNLLNSAIDLYTDRDFKEAQTSMHSCLALEPTPFNSLRAALIDCEVNDKDSAVRHLEAFIGADPRKHLIVSSSMPAALMTLAQNMDRFGRPDLADKCLDRMLSRTDDGGEKPKAYWRLAEHFPCKSREERFNRGYALASNYFTMARTMDLNGQHKKREEYRYWPEVNLNTNDPIVLYIRGGRRGYGQATPFEREANFRKLLDIVKDDMPFRKKCWGGLLAAIYQQRPYDRKKYRYWQKISCAETGEPFHEDQPGVLTGPRPGEKFVLREEIKKQWESMHK